MNILNFFESLLYWTMLKMDDCLQEKQCILDNMSFFLILYLSIVPNHMYTFFLWNQHFIRLTSIQILKIGRRNSICIMGWSQKSCLGKSVDWSKMFHNKKSFLHTFVITLQRFSISFFAHCTHSKCELTVKEIKWPHEFIE